MPREGLFRCRETGECKVRITALGALVVIAVGVAVYVLWQRGNQNPPDQPDENTEW